MSQQDARESVALDEHHGPEPDPEDVQLVRVGGDGRRGRRGHPDLQPHRVQRAGAELRAHQVHAGQLAVAVVVFFFAAHTV